MSILESWGWDPAWDSEFRSLSISGTEPARVVRDSREHYWCQTASDLRLARPSGVLRRDGALPVAGDWVAIREPDPSGPSTIAAVLPRRTALARAIRGVERVLAANADLLAVVTAAGTDWNPRRLERYLSLASSAGIPPLIVANKSDLATPADLARALEALSGVRLAAVSAKTGAGLGDLLSLFRPRATIALVGSSGVGKTTLVNRLLGREAFATNAVRERDGRGRHTTTRREIVRLPGGALLLDTPGLREVGLTRDADPSAVFDEVTRLANDCRFRDCAHESEPGCAVREAAEAGSISRDRLDGYEKLRREAAYESRRGDRAAESEKRRRDARLCRDMRRHGRWREG